MNLVAGLFLTKNFNNVLLKLFGLEVIWKVLIIMCYLISQIVLKLKKVEQKQLIK